MRKMKPILFNTEMVRAILDGRKTVTRRCIKKWQGAKDCMGVWRNIDEDGKVYIKDYKYDPCWMEEKYYIKRYAKYQVGDILYVKETWNQLAKVDKDGYTHYDDLFYVYKADKEQCDLYDDDGMYLDDTHRKWKPSIHMPKEAARIFLRVTDVRIERLREITEEQALKEGIKSYTKDGQLMKYAVSDTWWRNYCSKHKKEFVGTYWQEMPRSIIEAFYYLWKSTIKKAELNQYGWYANPYVWVYKFEVISKEETIGK